MSAALVECHDCGLRFRMTRLEPGAAARCTRCGAVLRTHSSGEPALALAVTGLVLIVIANFAPFLSFGMEGQVDESSLATGAVILAGEGLWPLTVIILLLTVVMPAAKLGAVVYTLGALGKKRPPRRVIPVLRTLDLLHPWSMIEVYLLGLFVAYVKLAQLATVRIGVAVWALGAVVVVMALVDHFIDYDDLWEAVEAKGLANPPAPRPGAALTRCAVCGLVAEADHNYCPRCRARVFRRKPESLARTWALVLTAAILYIPANVFPIMTVISFGQGAPDTILSGVKHLIESGMWPLAALVFFASITVPVLKILGLALLLVTTQKGSRWHLRDRTRLFRVIEAVGRWSMIDIFMLSILVGLVRLGALATIVPGIGAISFAAVVIITIFAAMTFDPRLMWDSAGENR